MNKYSTACLSIFLLLFVSLCAYSQQNFNTSNSILVAQNLIEMVPINNTSLSVPLSNSYNNGVGYVIFSESVLDEDSNNYSDYIYISLLAILAIFCLYKLFRKE